MEEIDTDQAVHTYVPWQAHKIAREHRLLRLLGFPLYPTGEEDRATDDVYNFVGDAFMEDQYVISAPGRLGYETLVEQYGKPRIDSLLQDADRAKGVLVGISPKIFLYGRPRMGESSEALRINMRQIPIQDAFSCIVPRGPIEASFFKFKLNPRG